MSSATFPPVYDELIDVLAEDVAPDRLLAFRLSPGKQKKLDELLAKNRAAGFPATSCASRCASARILPRLTLADDH